jgi:hypothetical protein
VGGFLAPSARCALLRLPASALLAAGTHALLGGGGLPAFALLVLAVGAAASGLAAVGRVVGAGAAGAGAAGAGVLWVAMTGLLWADDVAAGLAPARRHPFRQAVLHLDVATAAAYDAARHDRLREPAVYERVPLATSLVEPPAALPTGAAWLALGVCAWLVAVPLRRRLGVPSA